TASHNPAQYNGIKMCRARAVAIGQDSGLLDIRDRASQYLAEGLPAAVTPGSVEQVDLLRLYAEYLRNLVDLSGIRPLKVVVDAEGKAVSPSAITALVATRELAKSPGSSVIHNLITSHAVPEIVREHGGVPIRTRVGHSFIKGEMAKSGAVFGGEHSAHYY